MGKRFTKREVSRLLGAVPRSYSDHAHAPLCRDLARVVRQMRRDLAGRTWRPIASAPKDGTFVLGLTDCDQRAMAWDEAWHGWFSRNNILCRPTHWMPLPDAPGEG